MVTYMYPTLLTILMKRLHVRLQQPCVTCMCGSQHSVPYWCIELQSRVVDSWKNAILEHNLANVAIVWLMPLSVKWYPDISSQDIFSGHSLSLWSVIGLPLPYGSNSCHEYNFYFKHCTAFIDPASHLNKLLLHQMWGLVSFLQSALFYFE